MQNGSCYEITIFFLLILIVTDNNNMLLTLKYYSLINDTFWNAAFK